jgi:glycosyltransferase involved in cell wall biosynthesis
MVLRAIQCVRRIIGLRYQEPWIVSSQDPFETSLVARVAMIGRFALHHVQIHGDVFATTWPETWLDICRVWFGARILTRAAGVRVVSERIKRSIIARGVPEERVRVIPIMSDLESFLAVGRGRVVRHMPIISCVFIGRFAPEKDLAMLLFAFARAHALVPALRLTLVGEGPQREYIRALIDQCNVKSVVHIVPWTNEVATMLATADIFCLSSRHEGWGMVLLEAMAAGLPIVTTDVGCVHEVLEPHVHGLVVPVGDTTAMAAALVQLAKHPELRVQYGHAGHLRALQLAEEYREYLTSWVRAYADLVS